MRLRYASVDDAHLCQHPAEHVLHLILARYVCAMGVRPHTAAADFLDHGLGAILTGHVVDDDIGARLSQGDRGRRPMPELAPVTNAF